MTTKFIWVWLAKPEVRFLVVGSLGYLLNAALLLFLVEVSRVGKSESNLVALVVSVQFVFVLDNFWSFNHRPVGSLRNLLWRYLKHSLQRFVSVSLEQIVFVWLLTELGLFYLAANATVVLLAAALNLLAAKKITYT